MMVAVWSATALFEAAARMHIDLDAACCEQLVSYLALLDKWNRVYNLTSVRDSSDMLRLHVLDSLAILPLFSALPEQAVIADIGTGGGLPGIVLAICLARHKPGVQIHLVDTVQKKTAFLRQVKATLRLDNVQIHHARVENLCLDQLCDVLVSRAFASLADFVEWSQHLLAPEGRFLAMKGRWPADEIAALPEGWHVSASQALQVPDVEAERCVLTLQRCSR